LDEDFIRQKGSRAGSNSLKDDLEDEISEVFSSKHSTRGYSARSGEASPDHRDYSETFDDPTMKSRDDSGSEIVSDIDMV
jgi:hypothetical protein